MKGKCAEGAEKCALWLGGEGGREDDRTHGGEDKRKGKKEKRERTMSAD